MIGVNFPPYGISSREMTKRKGVIMTDAEKLIKFDKDKYYKSELKKLEAIFKDIPKDKKQLVNSLIGQAAFMQSTLYELSLYINRDGAVLIDDKGNAKEPPAVKSYTALINRYNNSVKQLLDLLPKDVPEASATDKAAQDELLAFVKNKSVI